MNQKDQIESAHDSKEGVSEGTAKVSSQESPNIIGLFAKLFKFRESGILAALIIIGILLSITTDTFLLPFNIVNVMRQMAETCIMAVGMTMLIIVGQFDLSVGSIFGLASVIIAILVRDVGLNMWVALPIGVILGGVFGFINGLITTKMRIQSFIVTLGMMKILRGFALIIAKGYPVSEIPSSNFFEVFGGRLFGFLPMQVIWMLLIVAIGIVVLNKTVFGYYLYATGSNENATRLSGVNTDRITIYAFIITGALAAFSGALMLAHLGSATPLAGSGAELNVIAAVVIGGTALSGGLGTVFGTFLGAAIMAMLRNGLVLLGVSSYYQVSAIGFVIIIAVVIDTISNSRKI